jgi:type II secretory pathway pseudopilin PulG
MGVRNHRGYFLIELMISIALISLMGIIIGRLKGYVATWHQEASTYLRASTLAGTLINSELILSNHTSINVQKEISKPFKNLPYETVKLSLTMPFGGKQKIFTFVGGKVRHDAKK